MDSFTKPIEITFDTANGVLKVVFSDGEAAEYRQEDAAAYVAKTGREQDIAAMGWKL